MLTVLPGDSSVTVSVTITLSSVTVSAVKVELLPDSEAPLIIITSVELSPTVMPVPMSVAAIELSVVSNVTADD